MPDSVVQEIGELRTLLGSERDPDRRAFVPLADAYRRQGDLARALELLEEGLGRHASFAPAHIVAAWVRRDRGELDLAGQEFGAALALDEENTEALRGLGEIAAARGDRAGATGHYHRLIELEPHDLEIVARLRELEMAAAPAAVAEPLAAEEPVDDLPLLMPEEPATPPPAPPAPAPAAPAPGPLDEDGPVTRTMADLYARQGLHERALGVYRKLRERTPDDAGLAERVAEVSALLAAAPPSAPGRPTPPAAATTPRPTDHELVEKVAQHMAEGPSATGDLSTPFAWAPKPAAPAEEARREPGRPVKEYFKGILAWEPPVVQESAPALPDPPAPAPVAAAAPAKTPEATKTPEPAAVPVKSLAPDRPVVPIESLAPDGIVPIESLAPVIVEIATLAPGHEASWPFEA